MHIQSIAQSRQMRLAVLISQLAEINVLEFSEIHENTACKFDPHFGAKYTNIFKIVWKVLGPECWLWNYI